MQQNISFTLVLRDSDNSQNSFVFIIHLNNCLFKRILISVKKSILNTHMTF